MPLDPILRRTFNEPDRAEAEARIVAEVEADPERFIAAYVAHPESFGGRYVSADLFKETLPLFAGSIEGRGRYNTPAHNAAATLSAEQFRRTLIGTGDDGIFLTGVPGSGKTTTVLTGDRLADNFRFVFEGQLASPERGGFEKFQAAIDAGVQPTIVAVLASPEEALRNTFRRFELTGRGATIDVMADIAGNLPVGLAAIRERFGDDVQLQVRDVRDRADPKRYKGWETIEILREEGNRDEIADRLRRELDRQQRAGTIGADAYAQAVGQAPFAEYRGLAGPIGRGLSSDGEGPGVSAENPEPGFVAAEAEAVLASADAGDREAEQIGATPSIEERWSEAIDVAVEGKQEQADRLVDRLETMIEAQEVRINQARSAQPGFLALPGQRARAQHQLDQAQQTMSTLTARLERVREIRQEPDPDHPRSIPAMARAQLRHDAPELFEELTASRVAQTMREQAELSKRRTLDADTAAAGRSLSHRQKL